MYKSVRGKLILNSISLSEFITAIRVIMGANSIELASYRVRGIEYLSKIKLLYHSPEGREIFPLNIIVCFHDSLFCSLPFILFCSAIENRA